MVCYTEQWMHLYINMCQEKQTCSFNPNSMQVGGKDVKVLTCDSCVKSSKRSSQTESHDSGTCMLCTCTS